MAQRVYGVVSQKGGVGKSSIAQGIAVHHALAGRRVLLADLDPGQETSHAWYGDRAEKIPKLDVKKFRNVQDVSKISDDYQVIVFDGAAHASEETFAIAEVSDRLFIPSGSSMADMRPAARLAHELLRKGIDPKTLRIVLMKIASVAEGKAALDAFREQNLKTLGQLRFSLGYQQAQDAGKAPQEAAHPGLRKHAEEFIHLLTK